MAEALFVWLGSKRARKRGVPTSGALLDEAARARLPVPTGGILLTDFYEVALAEGLLQVANGRIVCPYPSRLHELLYQRVRFPPLAEAVDVSLLAAGTDKLSFSQHNIYFTEVKALSESLCEVYSAALPQPEEMRRDVLVRETIASDVVGTAVTDIQQSADSIAYNEQRLDLPQLRLFQSASPDIPAFGQRLQKLLRGVRRTFGKGEWLVNWADDGEVCWLVGLSSLTNTETT